MKTRKKLKPSVNKIILFLITCGICGIIYSTYKIISWKSDNKDNEKIQETIEQLITPIDDKETENKYIIDFQTLKEQNPDTIAYLKVNNTNIDYIVVKPNDNNYYLNHNFNKEKNNSGWIFADYKNQFDETDKNIVIYGHNTIDGSMFGTLKKILEKSWYENPENHNILLITEKGTYTYQVFSTYTIIPEDYYINTEFKNNKEFEEFLHEIKSRSFYDYGVNISQDDKILTLSSCIKSGKKRVALHAKLIKEEN